MTTASLVIVIQPPSGGMSKEELAALLAWRQLDRLQKELREAGFAVQAFTGALSDAPESRTYLLLADNAHIGEGAADDRSQSRLARTIVIDEIDRDASRLAERHGLLGVVDHLTYAAWADRTGPAQARLAAKRTVAAVWKAPFHTVNSTKGYVLLNAVSKTLPRLLFDYVRDALPS